jgi:nitrogen fixation protein FixH
MTEITLKPLTGKHVLACILGFFGLVMAANIAFVVAALTTFNGGEGGKAYQTGLEYNRTIAAARQQDTLGWTHSISAGVAGEVRVELTDMGHSPVRGLALSGEIARPVADKFTQALSFKEVQPGVYVADADVLEPGNWMVNLQARSDQHNHAIIYRARKRLWLKPNS